MINRVTIPEIGTIEMDPRKLNLTDRCLAELDNALRAVLAHPHPARPVPAIEPSTDTLGDTERAAASRLMRVNHSGEVAAQALYRGQAFVARDARLRASLLQAAAEEHDHLAWCWQRAHALGGGSSKLTPAWYAGSFAIGMLAGAAGDRISLGFLAETEKQVAEHLDGHLHRLPANDHQSRAILRQMRSDEVAHGKRATDSGGKALPKPVRALMRLASRVMTGFSYRV